MAGRLRAHGSLPAHLRILNQRKSKWPREKLMRMLCDTRCSSRGGKKAKKSSMFHRENTMRHFCSASCRTRRLLYRRACISVDTPSQQGGLWGASRSRPGTPLPSTRCRCSERGGRVQRQGPAAANAHREAAHPLHRKEGAQRQVRIRTQRVRRWRAVRAPHLRRRPGYAPSTQRSWAPTSSAACQLGARSTTGRQGLTGAHIEDYKQQAAQGLERLQAAPDLWLLRVLPQNCKPLAQGPRALRSPVSGCLQQVAWHGGGTGAGTWLAVRCRCSYMPAANCWEGVWCPTQAPSAVPGLRACARSNSRRSALPPCQGALPLSCGLAGRNGAGPDGLCAARLQDGARSWLGCRHEAVRIQCCISHACVWPGPLGLEPALLLAQNAVQAAASAWPP